MWRQAPYILTSLLLLSACERMPVASQPPAQSSLIAHLEDAPSSPGFDIQSLPISTVELGAFPYLELPPELTWSNSQGNVRKNDEFCFWNGTHLLPIQGQLFMSRILPQIDTDFDPVATRALVDRQIRIMGGVKITERMLPPALLQSINNDYLVDKWDGLGNIQQEKISTWVIRRHDSNIWVHLVAGKDAAAFALLQSTAYTPTPSLLPVSSLQQLLETERKVALDLQFKPDNSGLTATSLPQMEAIRAFLLQNPKLKLTIQGHVDLHTPNAVATSYQRADLVRAQLVTGGVNAARLTAEGVGNREPIADNQSIEGRMRNQRIELHLVEQAQVEVTSDTDL